MKEPESKLPWFIKYPKSDAYTLYDSENMVFQSTEDYYDWACHTKDAEYIVQAANNFPEAVRLLKELYQAYSKIPRLIMPIDKEVNQFLTKLEEDENIK